MKIIPLQYSEHDFRHHAYNLQYTINFNRTLEEKNVARIIEQMYLSFYSFEKDMLDSYNYDVIGNQYKIFLSYLLKPNLPLAERINHINAVDQTVRKLGIDLIEEISNFNKCIYATEQPSQRQKELEHLVSEQLNASDPIILNKKQSFKRKFPYLPMDLRQLYNATTKTIKIDSFDYENKQVEIDLIMTGIENMRRRNKDVKIEDHALAILYSYKLDPNIELEHRENHCNGVYRAMQGMIEGKTETEVLNESRTISFDNLYFNEYGIKGIQDFFTCMIYNLEGQKTDPLFNQILSKKIEFKERQGDCNATN